MTLLAVKSDQQIDVEAPNRGDETVGAPMAMTQQRAAQRSSTSGEAVAVFGLSHGRPVCFAREAQRNNNGRVARPLSAYTQMGGRRGGDGGGDERSVPEPKAGSKYSQPGRRPPCRQS
jgi:hypothetical protein